MKWGEFKRLLEKAGIRDDSTIEYIDIYPQHPDVNEENYKWTVGWEDVEGPQVFHVLGDHPED